MIIVIAGPQASGKGTQAKLMAKEFGLFHMESGKMLRGIAEKDERIKKILNSGELVPDEETINYMEQRIKEKHGKFDDIIFDGYPRSINQYRLLKNWIEKKGQSIDYFVYLDISEEEAVKRLSARRICDKCGKIYNLITNPPSKEDKCDCGGKLTQREDDKPKTIENRLKVFREKTKPVLKIAEKDGILVEIDGEQPIDVIFEDIKKVIENANNNEQ